MEGCRIMRFLPSCGLVILLIHFIQGSNVTWYQGCFQLPGGSTTRLTHSFAPQSGSRLAGCGKACWTQQFQYFVAQKVDDSFHCVCINSTDELKNDTCTCTDSQRVDDSFHCDCINSTDELEHDNCTCTDSKEDQLPVGSTRDCYGVYTSLGPYLTEVTIETDGTVAIVNRTTAFDITVDRAAALDITEEDSQLGHRLKIQLSVTGHGMVLDTTLDMTDYEALTHRPKYSFTEVGTYTIDVKVTNGISTLSASHELKVIYPSPHNLQVDILEDDLEFPACIPSEVKVTKVGYQQFAVFVDTALHIEASVSMGTNLNFAFWFEDDDEEKINDCSECTSVLEMHTFRRVGEWTIIVTVSNSFGWTERNITMVVVERQLSSLQIQVDPDDSSLATTDEPVKYIISVVTTSRSNLSLQVWYGDGNSNTVSVKDTDFPALVLIGDGREMDIVADYGHGCELIVEFEYKYRQEGLFRPRVALFVEQEKIERRVEPRMNEFLMPFTDLQLMQQLGLGGNMSMFIPGDVGQAPEPLMKADIQQDVLVVRELTVVHIEVTNTVSRVIRCDEEVEFNVKSTSRHNITVHWTISKVSDSIQNSNSTCTENFYDSYSYDEEDFYYISSRTEETDNHVEEHKRTTIGDGDLEVLKEHTSSLVTFKHTLPQVGVYLVGVEVQNALSSAKTSISAVVQCPIGVMFATCSHEYIRTGAELQCTAVVMEGSDILFRWIIESNFATKYVKQQENHTSCIKHTFQHPGIYYISIHAVNNVSARDYEVHPSIIVQDPILYFDVYKSPKTLLGDNTLFGALYRPMDDVHFFYCYFDFDFGSGRENVQEVCERDSKRCYTEVAEIFPTIGKHTITVYAYNNVSEVSKTVDVWVYPNLDSISIEVISAAVVESPTRFLVQEHGETMVTDNVYFTWKIGDDVYYTNSPLFQITFTEAGNHTLTVNATNPVVSKVITVTLVVLPEPEVKVQLLHELYVTPGNDVNFTLQGPLDGWSKLQVDYSDGVSETHDGITYKWSHKFEKVGIQQIFVTLLGAAGTSTEISSYIMVEEPVSGLKIDGSSVVPYTNDYDTFTWTASLTGGSYVVYRWMLDRTIVITSPEFETSLPSAGEYTLRVEADNDVSDPIAAEIVILVQYPVNAVKIKLAGNVVGKETVIQTSISAFHGFYIRASFGDGDTQTVYSDDFFSELVSVDESFHLLNFSHVYEVAGEYDIIIDVSNNVSTISSSIVFVPITNITLTSNSPWLIQTPGYAKVVAMVSGGADLTFTWNFSDDYGETHVSRYENQTSVAIHPYGMSGEYPVTFCVTGEHYPNPGVCVSLGFNFTVVDPIDVLKMNTDKRYHRDAAALEGNATRQVLFGYESSGSHVTYLFDFGDGTVSEVAGIQLPPQSLEMTMYGEARHVYTEVGVYPVMVTAMNPLGNISLPRPHLFHVQEPPKGLQFCDRREGLAYAGRVGQNISLCAMVTAGTNVTFDWKLGDQNDMIKAGPRVTHQYQTAKVHQVFVTAKNKVQSLERSINVNINYEIQGVTLIAHQKVVAVKEAVVFEAVVRPNYTNILSYCQWTFKSLSRRRSSTRSGQNSYRTQTSGKHACNFPESGIWTASVTAHNSISSATSETIEIEVQEKVSKLEIVILGDPSLRLVHQPITFEFFAFSGSSPKLTWEFGDGSKLENTTEIRVNHTFTSEGRYTITLTAANAVSSQTVTRYLFILEKSYCNQPDVTILLQNGTKVLFSKSLTVEADVKVGCNLTSVAVYKWSLEMGDNQKKLDEKRLSRRVLVLPPGAFSLGLHKINFQVKMSGTIVYAEASMFVEVIRSPLVSKIRGGVYRQAKKTDLLVMDGSLSYDPDSPTNSTLSYIWTCRYVKDNGNYGDKCFKSNAAINASCTIPANTSVLLIPGDCLTEASNFTFELTVFSEGRENTSFQVVHMTDRSQDTLDISIVQPYSNPRLVNADRKLAFYTECSNCNKTAEIRYRWTLKHLWDENRWNLARAHDVMCVEADGMTYHLILKDEKEEKKKKEEEDSEKKDNQGGRERRDLPQNVTEKLVPKQAHNFDSTGPYDQYPLYGQIVEGGVDSRAVNRRRRDLETTTGFAAYPMVKEETDPTARGNNLPIPNPYDISENIEDVGSRRLPVRKEPDINTLSVVIKEGQAGESGSSAGRQLGMYPSVVEGHGSGRTIPVQDPVEVPDSGQQRQTPDRLEGHLRDKQRKYTILDQQPVPVALQEAETKTGLNSRSLVIRPGVLKQGWTYILHVHAYDEERQIEGHAMSSFIVNESPTKGRCTISPESGVAMETEFNIICKEWQDEHEPLMYEVSYSMMASLEDRHLVYRGIDHEFSLRLPAGRAEEDSNVYVCIDILDALLAKTSVCSIAIRVTPRPRTEPAIGDLHKSVSRLIYDEVTSPDSALHQSVGHGNDAVSKVYISYLADALNHASERHERRINVKELAAADGEAEKDGGISIVRLGEENGRDRSAGLVSGHEADEISGEHGRNQTVEIARKGERNEKNEIPVEVAGEDDGREGVENAGLDGDDEEVDTEGYDEAEETAGRLWRVEARTELLRILEELPVRDEAEILQTAQALSYATAREDELSLTSVDLSVKILKSLSSGAREVYNNELTPTGNLIPLAVQSTASIVEATTEIARRADSALEIVYKRLISESVEAVEDLILNELKYHVISEEPISSTTDYFSVLAARHSAEKTLTLQIHNASFQLPEKLPQLLDSRTNENCFQSHMTSFKKNPYSFKETEKVNSVVSGLTLYNCEGRAIPVLDLPEERRVHVDLPNIPPKTQSPVLRLKRWALNQHQFNVSTTSLNHSLHLVIDLVPVHKGRLFPITVLIRWTRPPSPDVYHYKYDFEAGHDRIDLFFPAGTLNVSGTYYVGIVDSTYNAGRPRPGEITERSYTLRLWWGECLYWNVSVEAWVSDGCQLSRQSTYSVTRCHCNHLTVFGGRFQLIPNHLHLLDVDDFFSLRTNPVTLTLVSVLASVYLVLLLWCRHADQHDARKGGIVYLLDNTAVDQQKYEITVETGIRKGAGTTAKISMILHGEEGMSETRELISEDDRPMFERNSTDKFILTLPESIGRIWKVQIWHNNSGEAPSWYLSRVIVRDLNTGIQYPFQCDKWLAVEEEDGKVEREFMVQEGAVCFTKVFLAKAVQYMADLHVWLSLATCPPYSGFVRIERLTVCLTIVMLHMCFMAVWYQHTVTEYRGEFSLLDVSWKNVMVGAVCCALVCPISLLLEILFRRSKPKHASSCQYKDESSQWDIDYPSGKPNSEHESEDTSEHVPPVMTYSLLDQSILNWPNIQTWAQKQWLKRQQSVRSHRDIPRANNTAGSSDQSLANPLCAKPISTVESLLTGQGFSEVDQASSGFEDCSSLIRPKASVDSTHTTAAPSVAESLRTHKPQSLPDSLRLSKPGSVSDSVKTSKAPSISSSGSNKSSVLSGKKVSCLSHVYLPYWCRYIAWSLCIIICVGCAAVTIVYGFRFGVMKSILWLQSLYFSCLICVFVTYPLLVLLAVTYSTLCHLRDPTAINTYSFDLFNREKAKEDLHKWKKQMELLEEGEALERGVAARQRSRYLRFARPPQEKQLIEARKRVMKEKKAMSIFRETIAFIATIGLLMVIAYGKDTRPCYHLNSALRNQFVGSGTPNFTSLKSRADWYNWFQASFLQTVQLVPKLELNTQARSIPSSTYMIGNVQLRQQRVGVEACRSRLPYHTMDCLTDTIATETTHHFIDLHGMTFTQGHYGNFMIGKETIYDGSGYVLTLNHSRTEAAQQIEELRASSWLDRQTRAVFVEFTLYNAPKNLFTAVDLLLEMSPMGTVFPVARVTSTHLFRYVTPWDNLVLTCEMLYFLVMIFICRSQFIRLLEQRRAYFTVPWNILNFGIYLLSVIFCSCYVYRFIIVSSTVESLRSTYYEKYVDVSFITFWDEMLRCMVSVLLFLSFLKCLRLLRYNKQFAIFGDVYRRARREVLILFAIFCGVTAAYSSIGHILFGGVYAAFRDLLGSVTAVGALMVGQNSHPNLRAQGDRTSTSVFLFTFCIFGMGLLTAYMVAVLSHYFKSRRKRRLLAMGGKEALLFYWRQLQLWTGILRQEQAEEEIIVLPPEFTMAEIEYQVDELLFRMNALTGSHGLPEKPPCYLTDSDCTFGGGDDGISSGGSEAGQVFGGEDRLEQRVQKIEDNLCSQEPFLAQLLKLDSIPTDDWSQEKEKQLRSHLELEIFRQLQIQRQDLKSPSTEAPSNTKTTDAEKTPALEQTLEIDDLTSSDDLGQRPSGQEGKPARLPAQSQLTAQVLQELISRSPQDTQQDNSSSNPDSPLDKLTFSKVKKNTDGILKAKPRPNNSSTSSSDKVSPDLSLNHTYLPDTEGLKKPTKPTFLHSRESSLSEASKGSPSLKLHGDKGSRSESLLGGIERMLESSSGSEQDGIRVGRKLSAKRNLRKTKSRGKGKGADSLEPALIFDELEVEDGEWLKGEATVTCPVEKGGKAKDVNEHTVMVDIHHVNIT